ncbi:uncharacterized protein PHACADRAFT_167427 [Phanerochaete carnosa HHB-10118-sp]|uniref:Uncharacterized protein n=1 Tax=Phanerochaete carnosa (strain HHB-10118-sp) TaxID=650164 RepID=K5VPV1_PHACS|nr:uncharacterized protein PHACADRAFT_167427 [Phanerochaete carnosa HHB-10118-sp]EKM48745.1 hypothetical protein PHACADRAFT_167427 [Phanerochaete carnosa HHB-10118-sp]
MAWKGCSVDLTRIAWYVGSGHTEPRRLPHHRLLRARVRVEDDDVEDLASRMEGVDKDDIFDSIWRDGGHQKRDAELATRNPLWH